jgi:hypothetical protein
VHPMDNQIDDECVAGFMVSLAAKLSNTTTIFQKINRT